MVLDCSCVVVERIVNVPAVLCGVPNYSERLLAKVASRPPGRAGRLIEGGTQLFLFDPV